MGDEKEALVGMTSDGSNFGDEQLSNPDVNAQRTGTPLWLQGRLQRQDTKGLPISPCL
jgi:hypothetical protein